MSELTDLLLQTTDPLNALLLIGLGYLVLSIKSDLKEDVRIIRTRVRRMETSLMSTDGGPDDADR